MFRKNPVGTSRIMGNSCCFHAELRCQKTYRDFGSQPAGTEGVVTFHGVSRLALGLILLDSLLTDPFPG